MTSNPQHQINNNNSNALLWVIAIIIMLAVAYVGYVSYQKMPHNNTGGYSSDSSSSVLPANSPGNRGATTNNGAVLPNLDNDTASPSNTPSNSVPANQ